MTQRASSGRPDAGFTCFAYMRCANRFDFRKCRFGNFLNGIIKFTRCILCLILLYGIRKIKLNTTTIMTPEQLNIGLIEEMRTKLPEGTSLAKVLIEILYIGKEAVYRRLRSEVPFTLAEVATISRKLGISVDKLVGTTTPGNAMFDMNIFKTTSPLESYAQVMGNYVKEVAAISREEHSEVAFSSNTIPRAFSLKYGMLSKFQLYKWLYQYDQVDFSKRFEDLAFSGKIKEIHDQYVAVHQDFRTSVYVWDTTLFESLVKDLRYFAGIGLINAESVLRMKDELFAMIDDMEQVATIGKYQNGHNVYMYVSNVNFEATYGYMRASNVHLGLIRVYSISLLSSKDPELYKNMRDWIMSLTKFSILISQSGEMHRIDFFGKQRKIVESL